MTPITPITPLMSFFIGMVGALCGQFVFIVRHYCRDDESGEKKDWRLLALSVVMMMIVGGFYTVFVMEPCKLRQAFLSGLTAEGVVVALIGKALEKDKREAI
jgi:hypothetical protein